MAVAGYNIAFKVYANAQYQFAMYGSVQDDMTIAARTKERVTKDDAGVTSVAITGQDVTFRVSGLIVLNDPDISGPDRDYWINQALGSSSISFVYVMDGGATVSGTCIMTNYSESSNATDDATYTADFRVVGTASVA